MNASVGILDSMFIESSYGGAGTAPNGYKRAVGCGVHVLIDKASRVLGDKTYWQAPLRAFAAELGIELDGDSPPLPKGSIFKPMPLRWRIERYFAWLVKWRRVAKNWCFSLAGFALDVWWSVFGLALRRAA